LFAKSTGVFVHAFQVFVAAAMDGSVELSKCAFAAGQQKM
jgi:hypothetical protein